MLEVLSYKVYDLKESVIASGNAMRFEPVEYTDEEFEKGLKRIKKLVNASKSGNIRCHDNALVGIRVSLDIKYPLYWSPEAQRYHFFDIVTSSSTMHRLCKMDIRKATNKYVSPNSIKEMRVHVDNYNRILNDESIDYFEYWDTNGEEDKLVRVEGRKEALYAAFVTMRSNCPSGLELFMRVSTNYKQLQTMYYQRQHHKLIEDWQDGFCDWVETLPYFKEIIVGKG